MRAIGYLCNIMGKEIERKFLVTDQSYREQSDSQVPIAQTYLSVNPDSTVRVRIAGTKGFITVKTRTNGPVRNEWEYEIPIEDAREMMLSAAVAPVIEKTRYRVGHWEIDEFHGCLEGLTVAEIELNDENETFTKPSFIGREVTHDNRYFNSVLAKSGRIPE